MNLLYTDCYYCHSSASVPYATENDFQLVQCVDCGLLFVNPRPADSDISAAAKTGQHHGQSTIDTTGRFSQAKVASYAAVLRQLFPEQVPRGRWLDIGCGHGEFLVALQAFCGKRLSTRGTEPNASKRASAAQHGIRADNLDLDRHDERYDFISLLNVYSHLPDPVQALARWRSLLEPGGEIIIQTGDTSHLAEKDQLKPYYLPDHLSFASEAIVTGIMRKLGFEIVEVEKFRGVPHLTPRFAVKELLRAIRPNKNANLNWFPKHPNRDMWIRARLRRQVASGAA